MHLIVCVDDGRGMSFGGRRQSKDRTVFADILEMSAGKTLYMSNYSARQFSAENVVAQDDFLEKAQPGDLCFAETLDVAPYLQKTETVTIYHWNRKYPADLHFPALDGWNCVSRLEFPGYSHELITKEVFQR